MPGLSPTVLSIIFIFLFVLAVLWIALPFAVFGIKEKLNRINEQLGDIKTVLEQGRLPIEKPPAP